MALQQSVVSSSNNRVDALRARHKSLSQKIEKELTHPAFNDEKIAKLKREKLKLKEQIEGIRTA